jgi:hypothetical protein
MANQPPDNKPVINQVLNERNQSHETRKQIFVELEKELGRPVISFFTSFMFPVNIEDTDAVMLEGFLQKADLSKGFALFISSPGGNGLSAERIINICKSYSGTGEFWTIVPGKAKSAATMICLGSSKIIMAPSSELGPIDPQITIYEDKTPKRFSVFNIVKSYDGLFQRAIGTKGNIQPYLQQLAYYDERDIEEFRAMLSLSEDIAIRCLKDGMLKGLTLKQIKQKIEMFLSPAKTKTHGRPIFRDEASKCGLNIEKIDVKSKLWSLANELYVRTDYYVSSLVSKCVECKHYSFIAATPEN